MRISLEDGQTLAAKRSLEASCARSRQPPFNGVGNIAMNAFPSVVVVIEIQLVSRFVSCISEWPLAMTPFTCSISF